MSNQTFSLNDKTWSTTEMCDIDYWATDGNFGCHSAMLQINDGVVSKHDIKAELRTIGINASHAKITYDTTISGQYAQVIVAIK